MGCPKNEFNFFLVSNPHKPFDQNVYPVPTETKTNLYLMSSIKIVKNLLAQDKTSEKFIK